MIEKLNRGVSAELLEPSEKQTNNTFTHQISLESVDSRVAQFDPISYCHTA